MRRGNDESAPPLGLKELPPAPAGFHATALARELNAGLAQGEQRGKKPSLLFLLARLNAGRFLWTGVLRVLNSAVQFLPALCLGSLLAAIESGHHVAGLKAAAALFLVLCTKTFVESHYFFHTANIAVRVRATLQAAIYEKSLRLPEAAAAVPPVTLMQVDTGKAEELAFSAHVLWNGIFQVIGYSALLVHYVGMAGVGGLFVLAACLPLNAWLQQQLSGLNRKVLQANEARVTRTGEILSGIRAIRQMGWEDVFEQTVLESRDQELEAQRRRDRVSAYLISVFGALPPFMIAVVLTLYVLGPGGAFRPSTVFTALSLLEQIRFPLIFYPSALNALAEGRAALGRILTFLSLEEAPAPRPAPQRPAGAAGTSLASAAEAAASAALGVPAGRYPLSGGKGPELVLSEPVLVREGELVAIVGPVGAGKTTLAKALLGELPQSGLPAPHGRVAYCAQQPWIPSGTLREVIAGGAEFKAGALEEACSAALVDFARPDDEINPGTLSGGQQARVALARAVYHQRARGDDGRPVVASVLDDVTAALDPQVASAVTEQCLFGALDGSTRVVVTSDTGPLLRRCERILVMEAAEGELRLKAAGGYEELVSRGLLEASAHRPVAGAVDEAGAEGAESDSEDAPSGGEAEKPPPEAAAVRVTVAEERAQGAVPMSLYRRYFGCAKSPRLLALAAASALSAYVASAGQQWFIGLWTSDQTLRRGLAFYVGGVVFLGLLASALTFGRTMLSAAFARRSSREVHRELSKKVLVHAATRHFDANPSGRILQRFSKDLEQVDTRLPDNLRSATFCVFTLSGTMGTIALASPSFLAVLGPLAWIYARALQWYRPVARELKRLEPLARSPVYAEQAATAAGVATIRQLGLGPSRATRALASVDGGTSATFAARAVDRWFSLRMELLGNGIVLAAALLGLAAAAPGAAAAAGPWRAARAAIAVTQALSVVGLLNWTVRTVAQTETSFTSFQRVVYSVDNTEAEAPRELPGDAALGDGWPSQGRVSFKGVTLRYRSDLAPVLRGVDLEVAPGERVGIVGRTGSGKSTLLRVLLRTFELEAGEGAVLVDGLDVREVGLARLRSAVTVIPQENFLVTGSVRVNVDPGHEHGDEDVQRALRAASLGHWPLDRHIAASGGGISPGERQLLGIARAVLRGSRVVALDEVTSRVDAATDRKVQTALRRFPAGTTMLVVSHRLSTITDYDKVVVMEAGRVVEVGCPQELQQKPRSRFSRLLAAELSGSSASFAAEGSAEAALEPVLA